MRLILKLQSCEKVGRVIRTVDRDVVQRATLVGQGLVRNRIGEGETVGIRAYRILDAAVTWKQSSTGRFDPTKHFKIQET